MVASARNVQNINPVIGKEMSQLDAVFDPPAVALVLRVVLQPIRSTDAHKQRHLLRDSSANQVDNLNGETRTALETTAVGILAIVRSRGKESRHQISMGEVQLDDIDPGADSTQRRRDKVLLELFDLGDGDGARSRHLVGEGLACRAYHVVGPSADLGGRDCGRTQPGSDGGSLAACVCELDSDESVLAVCEIRVLSEHAGVCIEPDAGVFGSDSTVGLDCGGFDHDESWLSTRVSEYIDGCEW